MIKEIVLFLGALFCVAGIAVTLLMVVGLAISVFNHLKSRYK